MKSLLEGTIVRKSEILKTRHRNDYQILTIKETDSKHSYEVTLYGKQIQKYGEYNINSEIELTVLIVPNWSKGHYVYLNVDDEPI